MTRQQIDLVKEIMKEDNLESKIDELFCELKGLIRLGSYDEGHLNYSLDEYWLFAYAFVHGFMNNELRLIKQIEKMKCCGNCRCKCTAIKHKICKNYDKWELEE